MRSLKNIFCIFLIDIASSFHEIQLHHCNCNFWDEAEKLHLSHDHNARIKQSALIFNKSNTFTIQHVYIHRGRCKNGGELFFTRVTLAYTMAVYKTFYLLSIYWNVNVLEIDG